MLEIKCSNRKKQALKAKFEKMLDGKRFRISDSTPDDTDGRNDFDNDFSRIAMSAPIRRLKDKTQVFPMDEYDFSRNRLTHSVEVLCIARGLALGVEKVLRENGLYDLPHQELVSILQTAALIHDVGNPPFGHQGEYTIQSFFRETILNNPFFAEQFAQLEPIQQKDLQYIEGNVQGFRVLCKLGLARDEYSFNLTKPSLCTIVKYPYSSEEGNQKGKGIPHEMEKFGYLNSEKDRYVDIVESLCLLEHQRHPLTYLLEAADDIAYLVCDVEDGVRYGVIDIEKIKKVFEKYDKRNQYVEIKELVAHLSDENELNLQCDIQSLRIKAQSKMIMACTKEFCLKFDKIIRGKYKGELLENSEAKILRKIFKELGKVNIKSERVVVREREGKEAIEYVLDGFLSAILLLTPQTPEYFPEYQLYSYISPNYRKIACEEGEDVPTNIYKKFLLVTDYVFGMTDHFLMKIYKDEEIHDLIQRVKSKIDTLQLLEGRIK